MEKNLSMLWKQMNLTAAVKNTDELTKILTYFADTFPFENMDVLRGSPDLITPQFLVNKLLKQQRGGLCYELNALLYLILRERDYETILVRGTVYTENGWATEGTHVLNVVRLNEKSYVLDVGFGSNISRKPLEIDGDANETPAGTFRVVRRKSEKGTLAYEKLEQGSWTLKYAFHLKEIEWKELNQIKQVITESESSAFNEQIIVSQCLEDETYSINENRLRVRRAEHEKDNEFRSDEELLKTLQTRTNYSIYEQAKNYLLQK